MFGFKKESELNSEDNDEINRYRQQELERERVLKDLNMNRPLPIGMQEFEEWSDKIIADCGLPNVEKHSLKFALASMVLQIGNNESFKPNSYFINMLRKGASNQVMQEVMRKLKAEQAERIAAEQAAKEAEAAKELPAVTPVPHDDAVVK